MLLWCEQKLRAKYGRDDTLALRNVALDREVSLRAGQFGTSTYDNRVGIERL